MGDDDNGAPEFIAQGAQQPENGIGRCPVEIAGGFVAEQELGIADDRARDGDALLLPARQLARVVGAALFEPDQFEHLA